MALSFPFLSQSNGAEANEARAIASAMNTTQAVISFDLKGTILHANENFLKATGYALDEIVGKPHSIFLNPRCLSTATYREFWEDLRAGTPRTGQFRRRNKQGQDIYIEAAYTPVLDNQGRVVKIMKFAYDITERKLRELDTRGKINALSRAQAVIEFDLKGNILTANDNFLGAMGYGLDEIVGRHHSLFVDPAEKDSAGYRDFWKRLNDGEFFSAQFKRIAKGGREIFIQATYNPILDNDGNPLKIVKFATDVTERALRDADYSGQIQAISKAQAVIEFDLDGRVLRANDNFLGVMGYNEADIVGRHHSMFLRAEDRDSPAYAEFWERLRSGDYVAGEFRRVARNGGDVFIQASYNAILGLNGKPYKVVKYASDVTARRNALNRTTELSHSLQELSAAVEEMAVTGRSIADTVSQTKGSITEATMGLARANTNARDLANATVAMNGIVDMITNITGQINLLALNATIESARAGEAGRGFAVVATEVKNLANQARKATEQIAAEISAVRSSSENVVSALDAIGQTVESVEHQIVFAASAVEQQSATSQDMARNMQVASSEAETIVRAA
ncbi:PAS domain S-box protein [Asticcacaulis solisilvae]|uniref:PAS domain S-box protein n=1 Tax=Asticcacaulis solisilvae TaxID=1217274 RepID=UPI003FD6EE61